MPPIKTQHKRTAVGCWTCRRRRIKCDTQRPSCVKCLKSKLKCEGYDIKLNWSSVLAVNEEGTCFELNDPLKNGENSSVFQRSNIELCKWWVYDYYNDIDNDLEDVDRGALRCGPFGQFKYKDIRPSPSSHVTSRPYYLERQSINTIITKFDVLKDIHFIESFLRIEILPNIDIFNDVKLAIADYFLNSNDSVQSQLNFIYLLSIVIVQLMKLNISQDNVKKIWNYYNKIDFFLKNFIKELNKLVNSGQYDEVFFNKFIMVLNLKIIINTNLGIYQNWIFNNDFKTKQKSKDSIIYKYYKFFQITNQFINPSKYVMPNRYKDYYTDLTPDYNLLKYLSFKPHSDLPDKKKDSNDKKLYDYESRRIPSTNKQFKVKISVYDTPTDQIIRIPKYKEDDENKDEAIPPSFIVQFDNNIDEDVEVNLDDENNDSYESDEDDDNTEDTQYDNLFTEFNDVQPNEKSLFGISSKLIYLYFELCHLINHRRIFNKIEHVSRNWMRIISDYEDLLIRQIPRNLFNDQSQFKENDEIFHNFLSFCFFKYVKNYPLKYVANNLDKIVKNDLNIGIIKFLSHNLLKNDISKKDKENENFPIYGNNFDSKEFLTNLTQDNFDKFNDWDIQPKGFFVI